METLPAVFTYGPGLVSKSVMVAFSESCSSLLRLSQQCWLADISFASALGWDPSDIQTVSITHGTPNECTFFALLSGL
jgi:hypothetical protein